MWLTSIAMCYLDCFIDNLNYTFQDFLIIFFELLARIALVVYFHKNHTLIKECGSIISSWVGV